MKHCITTLAAAAALALALPAQAVTVTGSATPGSTTVGGTGFVTLTLDISEAFTPTSLTFKLDWATALGLDTSASTAFGLSWNALAGTLNPDPFFTTITLQPHQLDVGTFADVPALPGGTFVVKMAFTGLSAGTHAVNYSLDLGDPDSGPDFSVLGSSSVTVSAVPEANPAMMLAAGLAVMGLLACRRRA